MANKGKKGSKGKKSGHFVPVEDAPGGGLSDRSRELVALGICGFSLYALLCMATYRAPGISPVASVSAPIPLDGLSNLGGTFGYYLASGFTYTLGLAGWIPFLAFLGYGVALFLHKPIERLQVKALGVVCLAAILSLLLADPSPAGFDRMTALTPEGAGGRFGAVLSPRLQNVFGGPGRILLLVFGGLVSLLLVTEWMFSQMLERSALAITQMWQRFARRPAMAGAGILGDEAEAEADGETQRPKRSRSGRSEPAKKREAMAVDDPDQAAKAADESGSEAEPPTPRAAEESSQDIAAEEDGVIDVSPARAEEAVVPPAAEEQAVAAPASRKPVEIVVKRPAPKRRRPRPRRRPADGQLPFGSTEYPYPPVALFAEVEEQDQHEAGDELDRGSEAIVSKLASFGVETEVVAASVGPAVTLYELRLAEGIRINKITGFEGDLAAALKAVSVRVVAPIPGKDTVGVEVPNRDRQKVSFRDLLDQFGMAEDLAIPLLLGKDVAGEPIVEDLARMPHLLIAGTTGSGKSVCINAILLSILMTRTPRQVKLILIDPKQVELQAYKNAPHLCCDVVTNMKKAPAVLQWAVDEMENRYSLLSSAGVNHINSYNRLGQQEIEKRLGRSVEAERLHLPYIVVVIDEFADLMNMAANEVEESIQRLAQKSRAVGLHVIVATQRPSSDVITGIIKANLPCQIAFKVNRKIDSRVILDSNGAEKLLGHGDMLYVPPGGGVMTRAQGAFVAEAEMHAVVGYLENKGQRPSFLPALVQTQSSSRQGMASKDELYREAVEVVLTQQRGSATLLQRALSVGYTRGTRLLEMMEEDGIVGPFVGSKSRDVLLTLDEWKEREAAAAAELEALEAEEFDDEYEDYDEEAEEVELPAGEAQSVESATAEPVVEDEDELPDPQSIGVAVEEGSADEAEGSLADDEADESDENDEESDDDAEASDESYEADDDAEASDEDDEADESDEVYEESDVEDEASDEDYEDDESDEADETEEDPDEVHYVEDDEVEDDYEEPYGEDDEVEDDEVEDDEVEDDEVEDDEVEDDEVEDDEERD